MSTTNLNLAKAQKSGAINLFQLGADKEYLLVIVGKTKSYLIPMLPTEDGPTAFVSNSYSMGEFRQLQDLINAVNDNHVFAGVDKYMPLRDDAPAHSKVIIKSVKPASGIQGKKAPQVAKDGGYAVPDSGFDLTIKKRDWSELKKTCEEARVRYEDNHAELAACGASYLGLSNEVKMAHEGVAAGRTLGIIFTGPTGTGKSWAAKILADHDGSPLLNKEITYGTSVEDLVGQFVPATSGDKKWEFVIGPLLRAYTEGWSIVLEEINYGQPGINATLNEFLDGTDRVIVHGKSYKKHPNFVCYMTMNPGYEGTEPLNMALKNRFSIVDVPALTKAEFAKRAGAYSEKLGHRLSPKLFELVYDFANMIEGMGNGTEYHENIKFSIRNAQRLCDIILAKSCTKDEFHDALCTQYLNALSCDNDNSTKLAELKKQANIIAHMDKIYEEYDFAEAKETEDYSDLGELFTEDSEGSSTGGASSTSKRDKVVDEIFNTGDFE